MRSIRFRRPVLAALGATVLFALPLALAGCGGSDASTPPPPAPQDVAAARKDAMNEHLKNQAANKQGTARHR